MVWNYHSSTGRATDVDGANGSVETRPADIAPSLRPLMPDLLSSYGVRLAEFVVQVNNFPPVRIFDCQLPVYAQ